MATPAQKRIRAAFAAAAKSCKGGPKQRRACVRKKLRALLSGR